MTQVVDIPDSLINEDVASRRNNKCEPFSLVIFGATGDLTKRKLIPALYKLYLEGLLPDKFSIVGFARRDWGDEGFREKLLEAVSTLTSHDTSEEKWAPFARNLYYHQANLDDPAGYDGLRDRLAGLAAEKQMPANYLFYLSTQPRFFSPISELLKDAGLARPGIKQSPWSRIIIEKPFGRDLESAIELNQQVNSCFDESQIYRIDHYLGKETVQNILVLRFANSIFEPLWNNKYVDHVQITVAETLGVEGRADYYEKSGALRDIVQNHVMQLFSLVGMEVPMSLDGDAVRDEKVKVLKALRPLSPQCVENEVIRAQYASGKIKNEKVAGYLHEPGVAEDSVTETYLAFKTYIDNWRWAGVPFYIRTGKRLAARVTEINIHFKPVPNILFNQAPFGPMQPNVLVLRIQPDESILLQFQVKFPGPSMRIEPLKMDFEYQDTFGKAPPEAYERLLLDAALGDSTLFTRSDEVEQSWTFFEPVLESSLEPGIILPSYRSGTWGPKEADELLARDGRQWQIFQPPESGDRCYI
jgi:glucose-6-phosphate 1-dehydrogenase